MTAAAVTANPSHIQCIYNNCVNLKDPKTVDYKNFNHSLKNFFKYQGEINKEKKQGKG